MKGGIVSAPCGRLRAEDRCKTRGMLVQEYGIISYGSNLGQRISNEYHIGGSRRSLYPATSEAGQIRVASRLNQGLSGRIC